MKAIATTILEEMIWIFYIQFIVLIKTIQLLNLSWEQWKRSRRNASFKLKQDNRTFNIYEEKGNKFEIVGDTKSLNKSEKEIFEKKKS